MFGRTNTLIVLFLVTFSCGSVYPNRFATATVTHYAMTTKLRSILPVFALVVTALVLTGCAGGTLIGDIMGAPGMSILGLIILILDIIALVEIAGSTKSTGSKVLWFLIIIFFQFFGLIAYYIFGREK